MPDIEERVTTLEREMSALKARVGANEDRHAVHPGSDPCRVPAHQQPDRSPFPRRRRAAGSFQRKVDALPRVVAEVMLEMLAERDK